MVILPILTTPHIRFSLKNWENVLFELGSGRVNSRPPPKAVKSVNNILFALDRNVEVLTNKPPCSLKLRAASQERWMSGQAERKALAAIVVQNIS